MKMKMKQIALVAVFALLAGCASNANIAKLDADIEASRRACLDNAAANTTAQKYTGQEAALVVMANALAGIDTTACKITNRYDYAITQSQERTKRWQAIVAIFTSPLGISIALNSKPNNNTTTTSTDDHSKVITTSTDNHSVQQSTETTSINN